jgi:hypothetical protein
MRGRRVAAHRTPCDLVKGSRFMDGGGTTDMELIRKFGNGVLRGLVNGLFRTDFTDLCYGFFVSAQSPGGLGAALRRL